MSLFGSHKSKPSLFGGSTGAASPHHKFDWGAAALSFLGVPPELFINRRQQQDAQAQQEQVNAIIDADPNLSPQDKAYAKLNPKAYIEQRLKVYAPFDSAASGGSRGTLGPDGQMHFTMAPSRHEYQGSVFDVGGGPADQQMPVTPQHEGTQWVTPQPGTQPVPVNSFSGAVRSGNDFTPSGAPQMAPQPRSKAEFDALPPGTEFIAPDGTRRIKPQGGPSPSGSATFPGFPR